MIVFPRDEWPFMRAPEMNLSEAPENIIMATRRKAYAALQSREIEESDEAQIDDYTINLVSNVRIEK